MSVLSALRACVSSGNQPRLDGDVVHLPPAASLPRKSATAWRYRKGGYLDLESIVFFLGNERLALSQYVKACSDADVQIVPFAERKPLLEYLRGNKDSSVYEEIDQDREQQQVRREERKNGTSSRRSSAPFLTDLPSRPRRKSMPVFSTSSFGSSIRLPDWAWWWLLLSSLVMTFDTAYLFLRPHSLPNGSLHHYFTVYDAYLHYDPTYAQTDDPFTKALTIAETAQVALNVATLVLAATLPTSVWAAVLAVAVAAGTFCVTAFFFLYEAFSGTAHHYRLGDVGTWDVGYALGYVGTTALWIVFPLAIIVTVGGQFVSAVDREEKIKKI